METPTAGKKTRKRPPAEVESTTPEKDIRSPKAVPEEEVEEFFAILRRIHVAVKYFKRSGGGGGESRKRCRPSFDKEADLVESGGGGENDVYGALDGEAGKAVVEEAGLDLNLDPPPDLTSDDN